MPLLPTPEANVASNGGSQHPDKRQGFGGHSVQLQDVVEHVLPTPTVQDASNTAGPSQLKRNSLPLNTVANLLPTPTSTTNAKSARTMRRSKGDQYQGGGQSGPPGLEEIGTMLDGERPEHMPPDDELGAGTRALVQSLLPTPKASDANTPYSHGDGGDGLREAIDLLPTPRRGAGMTSPLRPNATDPSRLEDAVAINLVPTPTTQPMTGNGYARNLGTEAQKMLPTPTTTQRGPDSKATERAAAGPNLHNAVELLPTPSVADGDGGHRTRSGARSHEALLPGISELLPTPSVVDMGTNKTVEQWDGWVEDLKEKGYNGDGHGRSLDVEARRLMPTPRATDGTNGGPNQRGSSGDLTLPSTALMLPTPDAEMGGSGGRSGDPELRRDAGHQPTINEVAQHLPTPSAADANGGGRYNSDGHQSTLPGTTVDLLSWGPYEPAIRRWERVIGRVAPWATEPSPRSKKGRLSPRFVEWLMGWAEGWVTGVRKLTRNQMLRILGNGVVPQQAAEAVRFLLAPPPIREAPKRARRPIKRNSPRAWMKAASASKSVK